jgi:sugar O-acyltransferase (sialic acid O-acetyltransferase NeuD family)
MKRLNILGTGGHAEELIKLAHLCGYVMVRTYGEADESEAMKQRTTSIDRWIIGIGNPEIRARLAYKYQSLNWATLIHPDVDTLHCEIGVGCVIQDGVKMTTKIRVGAHTLINLNATIGHDARIGDCCHICPGVAIGGWSRIGNGVFIGPNATISNEKIGVGNGTKIGANSFMNKSAGAGETWIGNPARKYK